MNRIRMMLVLLAATVVVTACKDDDFGPTPVLTQKAGILAGTWQTQSVTQVDVDALDRGYPTTSPVSATPVTSRDITNILNAGDFIFTLDSDGTYAVADNGALSFVGTTGRWTLNNPTLSTEILFIQEIGGAPDTTRMRILSVLREGGASLRVAFPRKNSAGDEIVRYEYNLVRQ